MQAGRRRVVGFAALSILMAFVLSGCIQIEVESQFESDGSATHSIMTTVDRSIVDDEMIGAELEDGFDFDEIREEGEAAGYEVEEIDTSDRLGVRLSTEVEDNSDMGEVLNDLFAASGGERPPVDGFTGGFSESGGGLGGSTYRFELTVDANALFEDEFADEMEEDFDDDFGAMDFDLDMMQQFMDFTYAVSMPGEITDHNGNELGAGRVQWEIPLQGSETFFAESEENSGFSLALILGIGIGAVALALIIVGGIILMRPKKAPMEPTERSREF